MKTRKGFTLIELMIVVAIIGILAAVAIPKFADLIRRSSEGATRGNLGALRSALNVYYADMEGFFPTDMQSMTVNGKYLSAIPESKLPPYHSDSAVVQPDVNFDVGGWNYVPFPSDQDFGVLIANCTHTDSKNVYWTAY
jgi:prepilin-type N-terminal cleavage/methylation domain-containing protein